MRGIRRPAAGYLGDGHATILIMARIEDYRSGAIYLHGARSDRDRAWTDAAARRSRAIMSKLAEDSGRLVAMGIPGLDDILGGGLTPDRVYLVEGNPGSGKTTLALQYLLEGRQARGAGPLRHPLGDPGRARRRGRRRTAGRSTAITILELVAPEAELEPDTQYSMFHPSEVELGETTNAAARRGRAARGRGGSSSTRSPRCGCSPRTRSATAARSSP